MICVQPRHDQGKRVCSPWKSSSRHSETKRSRAVAFSGRRCELRYGCKTLHAQQLELNLAFRSLGCVPMELQSQLRLPGLVAARSHVSAQLCQSSLPDLTVPNPASRYKRSPNLWERQNPNIPRTLAPFGYAIASCLMLYRTIQYHVISHVISNQITSQHIISDRTLSYHITSDHNMS